MRILAIYFKEVVYFFFCSFFFFTECFIIESLHNVKEGEWITNEQTAKEITFKKKKLDFFFLQKIFHIIFNNFWKIIGKVILFHFAVPKYLNYIILRLSDFSPIPTHTQTPFRPFVSGADTKKMTSLFFLLALENPEESILRDYQESDQGFS